MDDIKPNSNRFKAEQKEANEKRVQKIVTGKVIRKPRKSISKATNGFISDDASNVFTFILKDTIIPAAKKLLSDMVNEGINIIFYGNGGQSQKRSRADSVSYYTDYAGRSSRNGRDYNANSGSRYTVDDVMIETRGEAESVLGTLDDMLNDYGVVRVADFYDLVGITGNYTDNSYGWKNLSSAYIVRNRDGYQIKFPRAIPLN